MEEERKEKAIAQALGSLKIDNIDLTIEFLKAYRIRKGLPIENGPKLIMRRNIHNGNK